MKTSTKLARTWTSWAAAGLLSACSGQIQFTNSTGSGAAAPADSAAGDPSTAWRNTVADRNVQLAYQLATQTPTVEDTASEQWLATAKDWARARGACAKSARDANGSIQRARAQCSSGVFRGAVLPADVLAKLRKVKGFESESFDPERWCAVLTEADLVAKVERAAVSYAEAVLAAHLEEFGQSFSPTRSTVLIPPAWFNLAQVEDRDRSTLKKFATLLYDYAGAKAPATIDEKVEAALASRRLELETRSREAKAVATKYRVPQAEKTAEAHLIQKYGVGKPLRSGSASADWGQDRDQNGTVVARVRKVKLTYPIAGTKACASVDTSVVEPFDGKRYDANGARVEVDMWAQLEPCQK